MESNLLNQIKRGKTLFVSQPRLTPYPCGGYKTPGAGGSKTLYNVYQPMNYEVPTGLKQEKATVDTTVETQKGAGFVEKKSEPMEIVAGTSTQKRKIENNVFNKMQHPIFNVSTIKKPKIQPEAGSLQPEATRSNAKVEQKIEPITGKGANSYSLRNSERKYYKF